jgi:ribitol 2-dehydrogenase
VGLGAHLNVNAAFRSVRSKPPHLIAQKPGDIVKTTSVAGFIPIVWEAAYTASQIAVTAFVHSLRRQVAPHGVRVCDVAPGPFLASLLDDWPAAKMQEALDKGSLMRPENVAEALLFMVTRRKGATVRDLVIMPATLDV